MRQSAFENKGRFYKGNLHTHTDISDGRRPAAEVCRIYRDRGYDFIAATDHNTVYKSEELNDILYVVPGLEIQCNDFNSAQTHHMVALTVMDNDMVQHGQRIEDSDWTDSMTSSKELYEMMKKKGFFMVYCHAMWSRTEPHEIGCSDIRAMEVYNGVCEFERGQGSQEVYWDRLLRDGKRIWGIAADDCHGRDEHYGRGYVMVKSEGLDSRALVEALSKGSFYSSQGPELHDFYVEDGVAHVSCSPSKTITFITYEYLGMRYNGSGLTNSSFRYRPESKYIRIEIEDEAGRKAWSNPIFF